jgi:hypothetical protein
MPKLADIPTYQHMSRGAGRMSLLPLFYHVGCLLTHLYLLDKSSVAMPHVAQPDMLPLASAYALPPRMPARQWVTASLSDSACQRRFIQPAAVDTPLVASALATMPTPVTHAQLFTEDLPATLQAPLAPIGLEDFLVKVSSPGLVSDVFPLTAEAHPDARSAHAKALFARLRADVVEHAKAENSSSHWVIKGLDVAAAHAACARDDAGRAVIASVSSHLARLRDALLSLRTTDRIRLDRAMLAAAHLANAVPLPAALTPAHKYDRSRGAMHLDDDAIAALAALPKPDAADAVARLLFLLRRAGGREHRVSADFLMSALLSSRAVYDLRKLNPFLPEDLAVAALSISETVLLRASRISQINRCVTLLDALSAELALVGGSQPLPASPAAMAASLAEMSRGLASLLATRRDFTTPVTLEEAADVAEVLRQDKSLRESHSAPATMDMTERVTATPSAMEISARDLIQRRAKAVAAKDPNSMPVWPPACPIVDRALHAARAMEAAMRRKALSVAARGGAVSLDSEGGVWDAAHGPHRCVTPLDTAADEGVFGITPRAPPPSPARAPRRWATTRAASRSSSPATSC